jgi:hypothetical protein
MNRARLDCLRHYAGDPPHCLWCGESDISLLELDHIRNGGNQHRRVIKTKLETWLRRAGYPPIIQVLCHDCHALKSFGKGGPMPPANGKVGKHYSFREEIAQHIREAAFKRGVDESLIVEDAIIAQVEGVNGHGKHLLTTLHHRHGELIAEVKALTEAMHTLAQCETARSATIARWHRFVAESPQAQLQVHDDGIESMAGSKAAKRVSYFCARATGDDT